MLVPVVVLFTFRFVLVSAIQPSTFAPQAHYDLNGIMMLSSGYKYTLSILIFIAWVRLLKFMLAIQQIGILVRVAAVCTAARDGSTAARSTSP